MGRRGRGVQVKKARKTLAPPWLAFLLAALFVGLIFYLVWARQ